MKLLKRSLVSLVAILAANGLSAHPKETDAAPTTGHAIVGHAHPKFTAASTRYQFNDGTTVEWIAEPDKNATGSDTTVYTVIITQAKTGDITYSLLTLGIQSTKYKTQIESVVSGLGKVLFALPWENDTDVEEKPLPLPIAAVGRNTEGTANINHIGFIKFSGKVCTLIVRALDRECPAMTQWAVDGTYAEGHDNNPPDPPF